MKNTKRISAAAFFLLLALSMLAFVSCGLKKSSSESAKATRAQTQATVSDDTEAFTETDAPETTTKAVQTATKVTTSKKTTSKTTTSKKQTTTKAQKNTKPQNTTEAKAYVEYKFRNKKYLSEHFSKHGGEFTKDFGYKTAAEYEKGASDVINNPDALFKYEAEDGDGVYYLEATNEFVILSKDGYIRTYFRPSQGKEYFDRQ